MSTTERINNVIEVLKGDVATYITIIMFSILILSLLAMIISAIKDIRTFGKELKEKLKQKESTDEVNNKLNNEIDVLEEKRRLSTSVMFPLSFLVVVCLILLVLTLSDIYTSNTKVTDKIEVETKISEGYEVYLDYRDGREMSRLDNYEYGYTDYITINDENREIIIKLIH